MERLRRSIRKDVQRRDARNRRMFVEERHHRMQSLPAEDDIRIEQENKFSGRALVRLVHRRRKSQVPCVLEQDDVGPARKRIRRSIDGSVLDDDDFTPDALGGRCE